MVAPGPITALLRSSAHGDDPAAEEALLALVYGELRRRAANYLRHERSSHTLQPTALVHETWLRLRDQQCIWENRSHFFAVAAQQMRRILVDHARRRNAQKRAMIEDRVSFANALDTARERPGQLLAINDALDRLRERYTRQAATIELRFFGGYTEEEIAGIQGYSVETVKRDMKFAKIWLSRELRRDM
jgi:RNA polymerase sigma factor (TIGR02999 family)